MAALADLSDLVNRRTGGNSGTPEDIWIFKDPRADSAAVAATVAGRMTSLWRYNGCPSNGAVPTTVAIPDNATAGGVRQTDPGGGRTKWLLGGSFVALAPGVLVLYDRLAHIGSLSGTSTSAQTVGGTLTRYTGGLGNEIWVEVYTQLGTTGTTVTASYTDQDGNSGSTTPATTIGGTGFREAERIIRLPYASGDTGVQACASVTLAGTTGTAGNFGVTIAHPLMVVPIPVAGVGVTRNLIFDGGPVEVATDACLAWAWLANGTTAPQVHGALHFVEA